MVSPVVIIEIIVVYLVVLFAIANYVEQKFRQGKNLTNNALIYVLSLAIYATAWTFYGQVGLTPTNNFLYLGVYIGPTLMMIFGWKIIRKLVRIKNEYGVTSIADFISARYDKSFSVGAVAALIALIGLIPYTALQLKAVFSSFSFITTGSDAPLSGTFSAQNIDWLVLGAIILFVIIFAFRRIDQTERHPGIVMVVAVQSIIKLVAFLAVGIFVTYFLNDGFSDIFAKVSASSALLAAQKAGTPPYSLWLSHIILSMSAILFLPRQFHVTVVENSNENHIRAAKWALPLYCAAITFFVFPIAMAGLLKGYNINLADFFILLLPLKAGSAWLSVLVFIGGLSAAISMIMISTITITTMTANNLLLPLSNRIRLLSFLRKNLLLLRWFLVAFILFWGYWFAVKIGSSYILVKIGMISFAAVFQFAPAVIGGLFWKRGNKIGALAGMLGGFAVWIYTSLVPAFARSGWISKSILTEGPFGINILRPENLFGLTGLNPLASVIIFTAIVNIGLYLTCSLIFKQGEEEKKIAENFVNIMKGRKTVNLDEFPQKDSINLGDKLKIVNSIFAKYLDGAKAKEFCDACVKSAGLSGKEIVSINELLELNKTTEKILASHIGAPAAHDALAKESLFTGEESEQLSALYAKIASELKITPKELTEKINYYEEREKLVAEQHQEKERILAEQHEEKEKIMADQREKLEQLVKDRTQELERVNKELKEFNDLAIGRELKMVELKKELETLKKKEIVR